MIESIFWVGAMLMFFITMLSISSSHSLPSQPSSVCPPCFDDVIGIYFILLSSAYAIAQIVARESDTFQNRLHVLVLLIYVMACKFLTMVYGQHVDMPHVRETVCIFMCCVYQFVMVKVTYHIIYHAKSRHYYANTPLRWALQTLACLNIPLYMFYSLVWGYVHFYSLNSVLLGFVLGLFFVFILSSIHSGLPKSRESWHRE